MSNGQGNAPEIARENARYGPGRTRASRSRQTAPAARTRRTGTKDRQKVDVRNNLMYRLVVLTNSLSRSSARDFASEVGLTVPEWRILSVLGSQSGLSLAALTHILAVDKGWVSRTVAQLERRGFVTRTPDPKDERLFALELSPAGHDMHERGSKVSARRQNELQAAFSDDELAFLYEAFDRLQAIANEMETRVRDQ